MTGIRENILVNTTISNDFLNGMVELDQTPAGIRASDVAQFLRTNNIPLTMRGIDQDLSVYDIFVLWHVVAMSVSLSVGNSAHSGPIFLPWHRMYLIRLEEILQQVLGKPDFGLPYWDWAEDGELPMSMQWRTDIWTPEYLGEARGAVRSGPISEIAVRLAQNPITGDLVSMTPRALQRSAGLNRRTPDLPDKDDEQGAFDEPIYDQPPWSRQAFGHRNHLEGWQGTGPQLHNRVHVWIGGDMSPGTSPNDPVFFLNHCNVDRIWEQWMNENGRQYQPRANQGPTGHRIDSQMLAIIGEALTPSDVLDPSPWYSYDTQLVV